MATSNEDQTTIAKNKSNELIATFSKILLDRIDHELETHFEKDRVSVPGTWCDDDLV